jgi:hypothetical protein
VPHAVIAHGNFKIGGVPCAPRFTYHFKIGDKFAELRVGEYFVRKSLEYSAMKTSVIADVCGTARYNIHPFRGIFLRLSVGDFMAHDMAVEIARVFLLDELNDLKGVFHREVIHELRYFFVIA